MFQFDNSNGNGNSINTFILDVREYHRLFEFMAKPCGYFCFTLPLSLFYFNDGGFFFLFSRFPSVFMALQLFLDVISVLKMYIVANKELNMNRWFGWQFATLAPAAYLNCMANCWQPPHDLLKLAWWNRGARISLNG